MLFRSWRGEELLLNVKRYYEASLSNLLFVSRYCVPSICERDLLTFLHGSGIRLWLVHFTVVNSVVENQRDYFSTPSPSSCPEIGLELPEIPLECSN